nr:hypothetical protein [Tanacetum cinerariifolium]
MSYQPSPKSTCWNSPLSMVYRRACFLSCLASRTLLWSFLKAKSVFTPSFLSLPTFASYFTISLRHPWSLPNSPFSIVSDRRGQRWMSFSKRPGKNTLQCYTKPFDSLKNGNNQFFWVDDRVFPTVSDWRTSAPKDQMPPVGSYSAADVTSLNSHRTPIQKQPEALLCLVGLSQRYFLGDDVYPTFLYDDNRDMDLFSLISALNHTEVKTETPPRVAHEVPLFTAIVNRTPSIVEKSPLDFSNEDPTLLIIESIGVGEQGQDELSQGAAPVGNPSYTGVDPEPDLERETIDTGALMSKRRRKRGPNEMEENTPPNYPRGEITGFRGNKDGYRCLWACDTKDSRSYGGRESSRKAIVTKDPDSEKPTYFTSMVGSPGRHGGPHSTTRYFLELRHLPNDEFLNQYNTTLARQVAMGSQLMLRFEQETKLLKKAIAQGATEAKNVELAKELESLRVQFSNLQVSNNQLSQQVSTFQAQIIGEERIKATFEEFKKYKDDREFADVVSARIAKCMSEGLKHVVEHKRAMVDLEAIEAYDPEADTKYVAAFHALKDLNHYGEDAPQWIRELHPSSSQLKISVYPEVCNPKDLWSFKDDTLLEDTIAANVSHAEKKKKCQVVCRTHRVSSTHHARSDGVPVSVPTVAPQGLAILLADAATQTEITEDGASLRRIRSKSLPPLYNLDWP